MEKQTKENIRMYFEIVRIGLKLIENERLIRVAPDKREEVKNNLNLELINTLKVGGYQNCFQKSILDIPKGKLNPDNKKEIFLAVVGILEALHEIIEKINEKNAEKKEALRKLEEITPILKQMCTRDYYTFPKKWQGIEGYSENVQNPNSIKLLGILLENVIEFEEDNDKKEDLEKSSIIAIGRTPMSKEDREIAAIAAALGMSFEQAKRAVAQGRKREQARENKSKHKKNQRKSRKRY